MRTVICSTSILLQKLHAEGKTEEARADLARLAIIRKQREEAAKKREEEKKGEKTGWKHRIELIYMPLTLCVCLFNAI